MADEMIDVPGASDGGLDGGDQGDGFEGMVTPQGVLEQVDDDFDLTGGDDGGDDGAGDWTSSLPAELAEALGGKYSSPEAAARALVESQRLIGNQGSDLGQLRDEIARLSAQVESNGAQRNGNANGDGQGQEVPSYQDLRGFGQDLATKVDNGEIEPGVAMMNMQAAAAHVAEQREQALLAYVQQQIQDSTGPLQQHVQTTQQARVVQSIRQELGDELYRATAPAAAELVREWSKVDPSFASNPQATRTAFDRALSQAHVRSLREAEAGVLEQSNRAPGGRGSDPAKAILDEMDLFAPGAHGGGLG